MLKKTKQKKSLLWPKSVIPWLQKSMGPPKEIIKDSSFEAVWPELDNIAY